MRVTCDKLSTRTPGAGYNDPIGDIAGKTPRKPRALQGDRRRKWNDLKTRHTQRLNDPLVARNVKSQDTTGLQRTDLPHGDGSQLE